MGRKVIIADSCLGDILYALIVRNAGFEVAEIINEYVGDTYEDMYDIRCEDGMIYTYNRERPYVNEICMAEIEKVEEWIKGSIMSHEKNIKHDHSDTAIHKHQNVLKNAKVLEEMIAYQKQIETLEEKKEINVLNVAPNKEPQVAVIENTLVKTREIIGGNMEEVFISDDAVLICNEEGKLLGFPANRKVGSDIIAGTFLIAGNDGSEEYASLTDEQIEEYTQRFSEIEQHTQEEMLANSYIGFKEWNY